MSDLIDRQESKDISEINKFIDGLEEIFADLRERHVDDSVCGLCEYDGAYIGQSGDWCNECPGFDKDDCFKLSDETRKKWIEEIVNAYPDHTADIGKKVEGDCISRQAAIMDAESWVAADEYEKNLQKKVVEWLKEFPPAELGTDTISRQAAIDCVTYDVEHTIECLKALPSAAPSTAHTTETTAETTAPSTDDWIPVERELPEDLAEVNVTWVNHEPEPYYEPIKSKPFTASAVYYEGNWYWYSSVCADVLAEYGRNDVDKVDDAIEITAWMPLPEPYEERRER